jgi:hypothetical protein
MNPVLLIGMMLFAQAPQASARDPQTFLQAARQQLDAMQTTTLNGDAQKKLTKLREDFEHLMTAYASQQPAKSANGVAAAKASEDVVDWKTSFDQVERDLSSILGLGPQLGGSSTPSVAGTGVVAQGTSSQAAQAAATAAATVQTPTTPPSTGQVPTGTTGAPGSPAAVGLAGVAVEDIGVKNLDPAIRRQLEDFRKSVELFYDATVSTR